MIKYAIYTGDSIGKWYDGSDWTSDRSKAKLMTSSDLDNALSPILRVGYNVEIKAYNVDAVSTYKLSSKYNWSATLEDIREGVGRVSLFIGHREFTYTWCAMGSRGIKDFLKEADSGYFCDKLCPFDKRDEFSAKVSLRAIKGYIAQEYPYFKHLKFQKDMRKHLKMLESEGDAESFIDSFKDMVEYSLDFRLIDNRSDRIEVESFFKKLIPYAWENLGTEPTSTYKTLAEMHKKLKAKLKRESE